MGASGNFQYVLSHSSHVLSLWGLWNFLFLFFFLFLIFFQSCKVLHDSSWEEKLSFWTSYPTQEVKETQGTRGDWDFEHLLTNLAPVQVETGIAGDFPKAPRMQSSSSCLDSITGASQTRLRTREVWRRVGSRWL